MNRARSEALTIAYCFLTSRFISLSRGLPIGPIRRNTPPQWDLAEGLPDERNVQKRERDIVLIQSHPHPFAEAERVRVRRECRGHCP
jgi:hypothetical protein